MQLATNPDYTHFTVQDIILNFEEWHVPRSVKSCSYLESHSFNSFPDIIQKSTVTVCPVMIANPRALSTIDTVLLRMNEATNAVPQTL